MTDTMPRGWKRTENGWQRGIYAVSPGWGTTWVWERHPRPGSFTVSTGHASAADAARAADADRRRGTR